MGNFSEETALPFIAIDRAQLQNFRLFHRQRHATFIQLGLNPVVDT